MGRVKLPEHYEKWIEYGMTSEVPQVWTEEDVKHGVRAMYFKLMEDMRPAIEALELLEAECGDADFHEELGESCDICSAQVLREQALAALKEKGLVD